MSNDKFDTARQVLRQQKLTGERALFQSENLAVYDSVFEDGESPLKERAAVFIWIIVCSGGNIRSGIANMSM